MVLGVEGRSGDFGMKLSLNPKPGTGFVVV